ncbi:MAG: Fibronectin type domain protein [Candidatus Acidoferrum typicum]|nr:Fibronectin type domain protein [Candidatus Acidoferrum typicum]
MKRAAALLVHVFFILACAVLACTLIIGCAAPGDPTARHPVVPTVITDLGARQFGSSVVLTFSLPRQSTDREALAEQPTIEIYRATLPPGVSPDRKTPWRLVYSIPPERVDSYLNGDRIEFRDPLTPNDFTGAAGSSLAYMVRTRVVKTRASGDSNIFTTRIYPPPGTPRDLRVSVTESAIVLSWSEPLAAGDAPKLTGYRVYRAEVESGDAPAPQDVSQAKLKSPLTLQGSPTSPEFSDTHFEFGHSYLYTVRAITQYGVDTIESADSAPAIVTGRDTFPPATPLGLEATIIPATPGAPAHIELSWAISSEADLAGYNVYRSDRDDAPGERMNSELLPSPTYRDTSVVSGRRYFYRVSAVDNTGNESPLGPTVQIDVP